MKQLLAAFIFLCLTISSFSQSNTIDKNDSLNRVGHYVALQLTPGFAQADYNATTGNGRFTFSAGLVYKYFFAKRFAVSTGIGLAHYSCKIKITDSNYQRREGISVFDYVSVPLIFSYSGIKKSGNNFNIDAGVITLSNYKAVSNIYGTTITGPNGIIIDDPYSQKVKNTSPYIFTGYVSPGFNFTGEGVKFSLIIGPYLLFSLSQFSTASELPVITSAGLDVKLFYKF